MRILKRRCIGTTACIGTNIPSKTYHLPLNLCAKPYRDILNLFLLRDGKPVKVPEYQALSSTAILLLRPSSATMMHSRKVMPLYRRCMTRSMQTCIEANVPLNFSSGAPDFQRVRGAVPEIEYMAVYTSHLRPARRFIWKLLHLLSQGFTKKIPIKYKL